MSKYDMDIKWFDSGKECLLKVTAKEILEIHEKTFDGLSSSLSHLKIEKGLKYIDLKMKLIFEDHCE